MFKNYLTLILRNFIKHKTHTIISILSLATGMCAFILIACYVMYEKNWDKFNQNFQSIYRIEKIAHFPSGDQRWENTQFSLGPALLDNYPEIKNMVRLRNAWGQFISSDDKKTFHERNGFFADNAVFQIFTIPFVEGSPETALINPGSIVLTETLAKKLFPNTKSIDKVLRLENKFNCKVTAVVKDPPRNSHIQYNYFLPIEDHKTMRWDATNQWGDHILFTYVLLQKNTSAENVSDKIATFDHQFEQGNKHHELYLKPLAELHLNPDQNTNLSLVIYLFSAIGLFALVLGCINYMNLSTACVTSRAKEIGIKKTIGASRLLLIKQFFCESVLFSMIAFCIAMIMTEISLPIFNQVVDRPLSLDLFNDWKFIFSMFVIIIFTGAVSGIYPAFYLSSLRPIIVVRQESVSPKNRFQFRNALVVFQFFISILLTIATLVIYNQINYMKEKNLGFDHKDLFIIDTKKFGEIDILKYSAFKNELLKNPGIVQTSFSNTIPFYSHNNTTIHLKSAESDEKLWLEYNKIHSDFIDTYRMQIIEGRNFNSELSTSDKRAGILNETAVKHLGWKNPVGKIVYLWGQPIEIIGAVKDFHSSSLHNDILPYLMISASDQKVNNLFSIRISHQAPNKQEIIHYIKDTFSKYYPDDLFIRQLLADNMDYDTFYILNGVMKTFGFFTLLTILIASFGLYGLISFTAQNKTKEIGIRKTLGASVTNIFAVLLKRLLKSYLVANLIAWPVGFFILNNLLQEFAYRTSIKVSVFLLAGSLGFIMLMSTVYYKVLKAATSNPVEALRYE